MPANTSFKPTSLLCGPFPHPAGNELSLKFSLVWFVSVRLQTLSVDSGLPAFTACLGIVHQVTYLCSASAPGKRGTVFSASLRELMKYWAQRVCGGRCAVVRAGRWDWSEQFVRSSSPDPASLPVSCPPSSGPHVLASDPPSTTPLASPLNALAPTSTPSVSS